MAEVEIPRELKELIGYACWQKEITGCSGAIVWRLSGFAAGPTWLKTDSAGGELEREAAVLNWVHTRLPAPRVLWHGVEQGREWLLISEVPGRDLSKVNDPGLIIRILTSGLKMLHSLEIRGCPFSLKLEYKLAEAKKRVEANLVDENDFEPEHQGLTARQLWKQVLAARPEDENLVFTHGDYCLPNVFEKNREVSGFVDWGRAGLADRYQDLALAVRSLDYNLGPGPWSQMLFREYGLPEPDWQKVDFYNMLDELF